MREQITSTLAASLWSRLAEIDHTLVAVGGNGARYAAMIILFILALMIIARMLKLSFCFLCKTLLPAALAAWAAGRFLNFPFLAAFPVLVALGAAWMLFRPTS